MDIKSFKRLAATILGFTALAIGLALLVLPGPGIPLVILGLSLLAAEFVWARHIMNRIKKIKFRASHKVASVERDVERESLKKKIY